MILIKNLKFFSHLSEQESIRHFYQLHLDIYQVILHGVIFISKIIDGLCVIFVCYFPVNVLEGGEGVVGPLLLVSGCYDIIHLWIDILERILMAIII